MNHHCSIFANSCLKLPVDPITKMPKTAYERKEKVANEQHFIDSSSSTCSISAADLDAEKLKDFYRSIPDYNEINHLPEDEFYSTLKSLREKKKMMLGLAVENIDNTSGDKIEEKNKTTYSLVHNREESHTNCSVSRKFSKDKDIVKKHEAKRNEDLVLATKAIKQYSRKLTGENNVNVDQLNNSDKNLQPTNDISNKISHKNVLRSERSKRDYSACSISWNDVKMERKNEYDKKFDKFYERKSSSPIDSNENFNDEFKTQSMPSSPFRVKRSMSPAKTYKSVTMPKPFKMTERDEQERMIHELRSIRKSFSEDMLNQKCQKRRFRAKPVPIESRIPLYDKILEDQAMRRAITKINSEAELRAQMKPFSFTKKEEKGITGICERAAHVLPKPKKKKRFKAQPVPKNLFSNYFYDKMKQDAFFRSMNRRIRAEELLRSSSLPGTMAVRDRSRLSTPAAHSDLPIDPSPVVPSTTSSDKHRITRPVKERKKKDNILKGDFITTSPKPFRFNTADRAAKKFQEAPNKMYPESKSEESVGNCGTPRARAYSALDLRNAASGRSNLAALLRAEVVRRKFEIEAAGRLVEQRRRVEMKQRDRLLRSKPAWHLVKNNHEEDIAMRLQTRRDEERMRREEFLHEMELMYGRVQQQPLLFERYYAPRSNSAPLDTIQLSPRKTKKRNPKNNKSYHFNTTNLSRKVSVNDTVEPYNGDLMNYLNRMDNDKLRVYSDSEVAIDDSLGGQ